MFVYEKKLQYPVRIKNVNPKLAAQIISQYGGPECKRLQSVSPPAPPVPRLLKNLRFGIQSKRRFFLYCTR